jgi:nitrate reductase NapAB chaperone NapD
MRMSKIILTLVTVFLLVFTAACTPLTSDEKESTSATEYGTIEIRVTDPPPADVKTAVVHLDYIEVHKLSDDGGEWIPVIDAPDSFDLMDVIGVEKVLGSSLIAAGNFTQIRMDVTEVTGNTTDDVPYTAEVPGDKLRIVRPFNVGVGEVTILTLDFDGEKSLIRTGNGEFMFKPVVTLTVANKEMEQEQEMEQGQEGGQKQEKEKEQGADELKFTGTIVAIDDSIWTMTIESENMTVDVSEAEIEGEPAIELQAEIEGTVVDDVIIASEVEIKETE